MEKTYDVGYGAIAIDNDGKKHLFATDEEATEYLREQEEDSDE